MPDTFEQEHQDTTPSMTFKVGEREYDAEAATKKISAADEHIQKLEAENERLRQETAASAKLEEALAKLETMQSSDHKSSDQNHDQPVDVASVVEEKLAAMLSERETASQAERQKQLAEQTFKDTTEKLKEKFGDKVDEEVKARAKELGISFEKAISMARDPEESSILLRLLGTTPARGTAMPQPTLNNNGQSSGDSREKDAVQRLRGSSRSSERTAAFRELADHYKSPEKMAELRAKWDDLHH